MLVKRDLRDKMKKSEVITASCGVFCVALLYIYLSYSNRAAKAEIEARESSESIWGITNNSRNPSSSPSWETRSTPLPSVQTKPLVATIPKIKLPPVRREHLVTDNRPINGKLLLNRFSEQNIHKGYGELKISNGLAEDAFVKVVEGERLMAAVYVRADSSYSIESIPDGSYIILYKTGFGWIEEITDFSRGKSASRFEDDLFYRTRAIPDGNTVRTFYDKITLTLHKVMDGNAPAEQISEEEFDKYQ